MKRAIIPLKQHGSCLDPTARIVREAHGRWTIYAVRGGYVATLPDLMAIAGKFPSEADAIAAAEGC